MERISEEKINEIRNSADIVNIISDYIPLKLQGKNYFGICPFHDDHTPSMSVSKDRQLFKCFVCGKGGNVFTFVQNYENISFLEAIKKVADKVGISLDFTPVKKVDSKFKEDYEIMEFTTKIFQNNLNSKEGVKAKEYLLKRNITDDIIKEFQIGFALDNKTYLYNVLKKKNYDINKLDDLGLISKDGIDAHDKFINRIMIPLTNLDGSTVGFTGRIFNGEDLAKYINTKETSIYKKGNMDAIRMYYSGFKNTLALMGTAITKEQVEILKKLRVPIILMLDNDAAGELATINVGDLLTHASVDVKVVRLKGAKDPDEYIVKFGDKAFKDVIKNPLSYFDYKLEYLKQNKDLSNTNELVSYVKDVLKMIDNADNLTKEITLKKISEEYNIDYELLKGEITFKKEEEKPIIINKPVKKDKYQICVNYILYYLMSDAKYLKIFNSKLGFLKNPEERNLITEIEYYIKNHNNKINLADFLSYAENDDKIRDLVNNICGVVDVSDLDDNMFLDYIKAIDNLMHQDNMKKIKEKINAETDINEQLKDINRQIAMQKKMFEKKKEV